MAYVFEGGACLAVGSIFLDMPFRFLMRIFCFLEWVSLEPYLCLRKYKSGSKEFCSMGYGRSKS
jgi:hypothetical protein